MRHCKVVFYTLVLVMISFCINITVFADETGFSYDSANELDVIKAVISDYPVNDDLITRAELAFVAAKIAGVDSFDTDRDYFYDVSPDTEYAYAINFLAEAGVITGAGNGMYLPDAPADEGQAIKVLLSVMGYDLRADAKGGYPLGYIKVASELDVRNISVDSQLTTEAFARILYELFDAPAMNLIKYDDKVVADFDNDSTMLTLFLGFEKIEGMLDGTDITDINVLNGVSRIPQGCISIDGIKYKCSDKNASKYLAMDVIAYLDKENDVIVCVESPEINDYILISGEDVISLESSSIVFDKNGKITTERISSDAKFFLNDGFAFTYDMSLLSSDTAEIILLDTTGDSAYDIIKVSDYSCYLVSRVDPINKKIIDLYGRVLDLSGFADETVCMYDAITNKSINFESIGVEDLLCVSFCGDAGSPLKVDIAVCTKTVSGVISEYSLDTACVTIDSQEYKINSEYFEMKDLSEEYVELKAGAEAIFYLDKNGRIAAVASEGNLKYGYVMGARRDGMNRAELYVLTQSGISEVFELYDKYTVKCVDKAVSGSASDDTIPYIYEDGIVNYQLIKYKDTPDKKIKEIHIADDLTSYTNPEGNLYDDYGYYSDNSDLFRLYVSSDNLVSRHGLFASKYSYNAATKVFDIVMVDGKPDSEKSSVKTISGISSNVGYKIKLYDVNSFWTSKAIVIENESAKGQRMDVSNSAVSLQNRVGIISSVSKAINENGDELIKLVLTFKGDEYKYFVSADYTHDMMVDSAFYNKPLDLGAGDLIQYTADGSVIRYIRKILDYSEDKGFERYYSNNVYSKRNEKNETVPGEKLGATWNAMDVTETDFLNYDPKELYSISSNDHLSYCSTYYGEVIDINNTEMIINAFNYLCDGTNNKKIFEWSRLFKLDSAANVYIYDSEEEKISKAGFSSIMAGDKVYVSKEWTKMREVVIYR